MAENLTIKENDANPNAHIRTGSVHVAGGCISKQEICFLLRPYLARTRTYVIREFFTDERLARCGLTLESLKRIRVFPPDVSAIIIADLKNLGYYGKN